MKAVKIDLGRDCGDIKIEIFGDVHIGSKKAQLKEVKERIKRVQEEPNTYAVLIGDLINNSTKTSVGDIYEEPLSPMDQMKYAIDLFEPIKDKILAITTGNHESRTYKQDGIDLTYILARQFGLQDRYDPTGVMLFVRGGYHSRYQLYKSTVCSVTGVENKPSKTVGGQKKDQTYSIYITHGTGGGYTIGGKANQMQRRARYINPDAIITGHTHQNLVFREARFEVDSNHCTVHKTETLCVNIASELSYEEYAEKNNFSPQSNVQPYIILRGNQKKIDAVL